MGTNYNEPSRDSRRLLEAEIDSLRQRLEEAEVTLDAITSGRVDALVVAHPVEEHQVLVLEDARRGDRLPIDRLRQGAITLSASGEVLHVNGAFAALLGCEAAQLLGRLHPRARRRARPRDARGAARRPQRRPARGSLLRACGSKRARRARRVHPARRRQRDLPDRHGPARRAEDDAAETVRALRRGEVDAVVVAENEEDPKVLLLGAAGRRYRLLVEHMRDGAVTLSPDGDVLYVNPSFAAMIGVLPATLIGVKLRGARRRAEPTVGRGVQRRPPRRRVARRGHAQPQQRRLVPRFADAAARGRRVRRVADRHRPHEPPAPRRGGGNPARDRQRRGRRVRRGAAPRRRGADVDRRAPSLPRHGRADAAGRGHSVYARRDPLHESAVRGDDRPADRRADRRAARGARGAGRPRAARRR